jgi:23S rRNA pseudouridine1911/1915/1917 synthase
VSKDESQQRMQVVSASAPDAQRARLRLRSARNSAAHTLLDIELISGRKHQIRLQLAHRGHPILGDQKYGASTRFPRGIALHCLKIVVKHPTRDERLAFTAPPPDYWPKA